ncbi:hypothetical protein IPC1296_01160 [Pseudomonas aeruginosa]|uniref:hypothetical protein n=1 Tax=Pseudomonas aeruginosa TaxID=287 RepID=UPI000F535B9F|nr:hypothetical protein [Pseudomonas aeruginosa]RPM20925.1 hypothetical protein IPC1296_01160 [Pseudomonas aeruginosa]
MSEVHSITTEHLAGASALDGEELTLALLRENEAYPPERPEYDDHGRPLRALLSEQEGGKQ